MRLRCIKSLVLLRQTVKDPQCVRHYRCDSDLDACPTHARTQGLRILNPATDYFLCMMARYTMCDAGQIRAAWLSEKIDEEELKAQQVPSGPVPKGVL